MEEQLTVMARAVKQISSSSGVEIEENARNDDNLLLETGLEEVQTVGDGAGKTLEVQPQVESTVWDVLDDEAHIAQTLEDVVSLVLFHTIFSTHVSVSRVVPEANLLGNGAAAPSSRSAPGTAQA